VDFLGGSSLEFPSVLFAQPDPSVAEGRPVSAHRRFHSDAWTLCSLCVTPLQRRSFYWLYPLAAAALLPAGLVEQRYFIVPVILFMLAKKRESVALDLCTIAVYVPVTGLLYYRISQGGLFL